MMNGTQQSTTLPDFEAKRRFKAPGFALKRALASTTTPAATSLPAAAFILLLTLTGCQPEQAKIGVVLPLTGDDAPLGLAARHGLDASLGQLADDSLIVDIRDSGSDPATARQQLKALIDEGAVVAIGGVTPGEARSLAAESDARERVLILPSASEQALSDDSKWVYRLTASDAGAGSAIAAFADRRLSAKTAAVLAPDAGHAQALESGFKPAFESLGGEVFETLSDDGSATGVNDQLPELVKKKPDLALIAGDAAWQSETIDALFKAGFKGHVFGARHLVHPNAMFGLPKMERILFAHSGFNPEASSPQVRSFLEGFASTHGSPPDGLTAQVAAESWDAVQVLALALKGRSPLPSEIRRGLRDEIKSYAGASGFKEFDNSGGVTTFPRIYSMGADGRLRDHGAYLDEEEERVAEQRRLLREKLLKLQADMARKSDDDADNPGA